MLLSEGLIIEPDPKVGEVVHLAASRCVSCARLEFPERATCPGCGREMQRHELPSAGVVTGFTAVLHQPPGALVEAPYAVIAATFEDALTILGRGLDTTPDDLDYGMRVVTVAAAVGDKIGFAFVPERAR